MKNILIKKPDDWHCHLRDGAALLRTVPDLVGRFGRVVAMPNLVPPVTKAAAVMAYRERIQAAMPASDAFEPVMTLYLTPATTEQDITEAAAVGIKACKLYPAGVTTHSEAGPVHIKDLYPVFSAMADCQMVLQIHGESAGHDDDIFDREKIFIRDILDDIVCTFPDLRIVLEHISTKEAVNYIKQTRPKVAATVTPHHLYFNRNVLLGHGLKPHYYCLPILKRMEDQLALQQVVTSGHEKFFLGTDSAPHARSDKQSACGCAGIYNTPVAIELCATIFEQYDKLDHLESFMSINGAVFYGYEPNQATIQLIKEPWQVPDALDYGSEDIVPCAAGDVLQWRVVCDDG